MLDPSGGHHLPLQSTGISTSRRVTRQSFYRSVRDVFGEYTFP